MMKPVDDGLPRMAKFVAIFTNTASQIKFPTSYPKRILIPSLNLTKCSNNYSEASKIKLTCCFAKVFTKFPVFVANPTLAKQSALSKLASKNIKQITFIITLPNTKHLICFDHTKVLALAPHYSTRIIREATVIEKQPNNVNCEDGCHPPASSLIEFLSLFSFPSIPTSLPFPLISFLKKFQYVHFPFKLFVVLSSLVSA